MAAKGTAKPAFVEPMMAKAVAELPAGPEWAYEVKWDGYRALAVKDGANAELRSRNNKSLSGDFPGVVAAVAMLKAKTAVLDGEAVALDVTGRPSFQALQNRRTHESSAVYYAFDLLFLDGRDLRQLPLVERRRLLEGAAKGSGVKVSPLLNGTPERVAAEVAKLGLEGVMAKRLDSPYKAGDRSGAWLKMRLNAEQEFVVGGYEPPIAAPASLLVGYYDGGRLLFASRVRAGFVPHLRRQLAEALVRIPAADCSFTNLPMDKHGRWGDGITAADMDRFSWVKPRVVVQVSFVEWTSAGLLRHPVYRGLRNDKKARDVVREV